MVNFNIMGKNLTPEMLRKSYNFKREACRVVLSYHKNHITRMQVYMNQL